MNMEHVEVLERLRGVLEHGKMGDKCLIAPDLVTAALAQQPAAVDDLNAWRAAFIAERAMRYREGGMAIEQARIHAETDAARMEALTAAHQGGAK